MLKKVILTVYLVFQVVAGGSFAQENDTLRSVKDSIKLSLDTTFINSVKQEEKLLENYQEEGDDSKLLDLLDYLENNPYDINSVSQEELMQIPFINSFLAKNIIEFRVENGLFKSKKELLLVNGMTDAIYDDIKIYLYVKNSKYDYVRTQNGKVLKDGFRQRVNLIKNFEFNYRTRFQQQLQPPIGYLNGEYEGSRYKYYNNLRAIYSNSKYYVEGNLIFEKDPGETDWNDFTSGYLELRNLDFIKEFIVGDYSLVFGQGLAMWSSLGFSKGVESVSSVKKNGIGVRSYRSTNESQFFRGAATQMRFGKFDVSAFFSNNYYDASVDTTLNEISSLYFEGYHRTVTERNKSNSVSERLFGSRITYGTEAMRFGATYWTSKFNRPLQTDTVKQLFNFSGDNANMLGFDYDIIFQNINLYGEFARSQAGSLAAVAGMQFSFLNIADIVFIFRDYPLDFAPIHSFAFGEKNGNTQNERGLYSGISIKPLKELSINAYYDQYKFPYRTYFEPVPLVGNDFLTYIQWQASKTLDITFKYRNRNEEQSFTIKDELGRDIKQIGVRNQLNFRADFTYIISNIFMVRGRYDYVYVSYDKYGANGKGNMLFSDFRFAPVNGMTLNFRLIFFNTDGWDSRLYEYETDVKGVMSNYAVYGNGMRWYLMARWRAFDFAEISGKYSVTYKENVTSMGSGNDMINGNMDNRLNFMLELMF